MFEEESEDINTIFEDIEKCRRALAEIEYCVEKIELGVIKLEGKEHREKFQEIYSKANQVKFQLDIVQDALSKGEMPESQFEKKLKGLIAELSKVYLDLDDIKLRICDFIEEIKDFIKKGGLDEEDKIVIRKKLDEARSLLSPENEWKDLKIKEKMEEKGTEIEEIRVEEDRVEEDRVEEDRVKKAIQTEMKAETQKGRLSSFFTEIWKILSSKKVFTVFAIFGVLLIFVIFNNGIIVTPEIPVVKDFSADVRNGPSPLGHVHFASTVTGNPTIYYWVFEPPDEDWNSYHAKTAVHSFHEPGIYNVSLTVENEVGSSTLIKKNYIKVTSKENVSAVPSNSPSVPAPEAPVVKDFSADKTSGSYPLYNVRFESKTIGNPTSCYWVFEPPDEDWNSSSSITAVHSFHEPGTYTVSLTVENEEGSSTLTKKNYIKVTG